MGADYWYQLAGNIEAFSEKHDAFLRELGNHITEIDRLAKRLEEISNRDVLALDGGGALSPEQQLWRTCQQQVSQAMGQYRGQLVNIVTSHADMAARIKQLGSDIIRPK